MKWTLWLSLLFGCDAMADFDPHSISNKVMGILEVNDMTSGQLFWLRGRVGEGSYTWVDQNGSHCTMKIPVAVGQRVKSGLGVGSAKGMKLVIFNQALNEALIQGERIKSQDWQFGEYGQDDDVDGWIIDGVSPQEAFILNSKKRWISWLLGETQYRACRSLP